MVKTVDYTYAFVTFKSQLKRFLLVNNILVSYINNIHYCNCNAYIYENSISVIYVSAILQLHNLFFFCSVFLFVPWNYICITCIEKENQPLVVLYPHYRNNMTIPRMLFEYFLKTVLLAVIYSVLICSLLCRTTIYHISPRPLSATAEIILLY